MKKNLLIIGIAFILVSTAFSQPFGIRFGMNLEQLKTVATIVRGNTESTYYTIIPFKKSSNFVEYSVSMSPSYGVYLIHAVGKTIESDEYGRAIKNEAESVVKLLTEVYGEPFEAIDKLREGSIWNEPVDWLTSVRKDERQYQYSWITDLPNNIDAIFLNIKFENTYSNKCYLEFSCGSIDFSKAFKETKEENPF